MDERTFYSALNRSKREREEVERARLREPYHFAIASQFSEFVNIATGELLKREQIYIDQDARLAYDYINRNAYQVHWEAQNCQYLCIEITLTEFRRRIESWGFDVE